MTPDIYQQLVDALRSEPLSLEKLHGFARDAGSNWSMDQLHLMLACMDGIEIDAADAKNPLVRIGQLSQHDELVEAIVEVIRSQGGRPLPAAQVLNLLPKKYTTSEAQVKKLARESRGLKVIGPGLISMEN